MTTEKESLLAGKKNTVAVLPVCLVTLVVCQLSFIGGTSQGYSSVLLAQLKGPASPLYITDEQGSWIASLGTICRPLGALTVGFVADNYGRKRTIQLVSLLISASWLLTYFSGSVEILYVSRILLSFALGMIICVGLYIVEVSRPSERGTLLSLITPLTMAGTLFVYILGYSLAWRTVALITCLYSLAIFFVSIFIPETPIFYMTKWKKMDAIGSLMWLRRNVSTVDEEIAEIEERMNQRLRKRSRNFFQNFRDASVWKPFLILSLFSLFQQQVGYNILTYYANDFFSSVKPISYESDVLSIISASLSTAGSLMLMSFVHKYDRKTFLYLSGFGMAGSMAIGAITLANEVRVVTVWCVFIYVLFCMLGMIDIPWMMIGELFPARVRGSMSGSISVVIFLIQFVSLKTYPALLSWIGVVGLFWYFAIFCSLSVVFAKLYFPETKDKSLFDIEADFRK